MFYKKVPNPIHGKLDHNIFSRCDSERSKFLEENYYNRKELENIKAKLIYQLLILKMKVCESKKITSLNGFKNIKDAIEKINSAIDKCNKELITNDDLVRKYGPLIAGHTPETIKLSKLGPRTKFQKDCDWLNSEIAHISSLKEASTIKQINGIFHVSEFGVKKIIDLSSDPMKLHAIWLAGWIQEAGFIGKYKNSEYQHFQDRYRIPCVLSRNKEYELSPDWLVNFLPAQANESKQLKLIGEYYYKSQIDLDTWMNKICPLSWMSHNTYTVTEKFTNPYYQQLADAEDKAFRYLDAKWTKQENKKNIIVDQS